MYKFFLFFTFSVFHLFIQPDILAQETFHPEKEDIISETIKDSLTTEGKRVYYTQRFTSKAPKIDGSLNDACWIEGIWSGNFLQHMPNEGKEPSQKTLIKILYDDKNIYVAIRAFDNQPDKVDRQLGRRDKFIGDIVGVAFDSYHDQRTGFEFDLTAGGSKLDLLLENYRGDSNWNAVWEGKVSNEDSAWTAEMKIPLSQLRYNGKTEQIWGLHAWRWINRYQEESNWNLIPRDNPGLMRSIGEIHGIKDIPKSKRVEFLPYIVAKSKFYEKEEGNPYSTGFDKNLNIGLDGKIGISSDFTLDLSVNPDFGQVEADPAQLNLSAFETYLSEKRTFFLEGKNITDFSFGGDQLFYSRRIGHSPGYSPDLSDNEYIENIENTSILGAIKLSGKTKNGLSLGIIESLTAKEFAKQKNAEGENAIAVEPLTNYFVGRIQKDINNGNTIIGGMITSTNRFIDEKHLEFMNRNANTGGLDFTHQWKNKNYYIDANAVFSYIQGSEQAITDLQYSSARYYQRPDANYLEIDSSLTKLSGYGGKFEIGKRSGGKWRYNAELSWRSPGLEMNDLGFMRTADNIYQNAEIKYVVNEPTGRLREYSISASQDNNFNFGNDYLGSAIRLFMYAKFQNKWSYEASVNRQGSILDTRILRGGPSLNIKGHNHLSASFHSDGSKKIAYGFWFHTHIYDDKISALRDYSPNINFKITNSLQLATSLSYSFLINSLQYIDNDYDNDHFLAQLNQKTLGLTLRIDYAITPELTFQYYGNPYISVGEYSKFKHVVDALSKDYNLMFHTFMGNEVAYNETENNYTFSSSGNNYTMENPNFNYQQFRSNLVLRWEYKTGSTLYFVWSHNRSQYEEVTNTSLNDNINQLANIKPENLFLLKFNYWFTL